MNPVKTKHDVMEFSLTPKQKEQMNRAIDFILKTTGADNFTVSKDKILPLCNKFEKDELPIMPETEYEKIEITLHPEIYNKLLKLKAVFDLKSDYSFSNVISDSIVSFENQFYQEMFGCGGDIPDKVTDVIEELYEDNQETYFSHIVKSLEDENLLDEVDEILFEGIKQYR